MAGGPAFLSGRIQVGDELIMIDGNNSDLSLNQLSINQPIGTQCKFTFRRGSMTYDVVLNRASDSAVKAVERVLQMIESLESQICKGSSTQTLTTCLQTLAEHVEQMEKRHSENETWMLEKIRRM